MQKHLVQILALVILGLGLVACDKETSNPTPPAPPTPACTPGHPCILPPPPGQQCPFGQYWNGSGCIPGQNAPGGYKQYFGNLQISNQDAAEDIVEVLTGQWFCWGTPGLCPNYSQGAVEIVTMGTGIVQVRLNIGGNSVSSVNFWNQGVLQNISNDTGSQITVAFYAPYPLDFIFITNNYRLDLGGTKDGAKSNQAPVQVLFRNNAFATGTLNKYGL